MAFGEVMGFKRAHEDLDSWIKANPDLDPLTIEEAFRLHGAPALILTHRRKPSIVAKLAAGTLEALSTVLARGAEVIRAKGRTKR